MMSPSRHKACNICRDRKVRCDGNQPSCEKCRRQGETCVYNPTSKPTKAELARTIDTLRDRIDSAESYFARHVSSIQRGKDNLAHTPNQPMNMGPLDGPPFSAPMNSVASTPSPFTSHNRNGKSIAESLSSFDVDFFNIPPVTANDRVGYRGESLSTSEDASSEPFFIRGAKMPSLREIRALNSVPTLSSTSSFQTQQQEMRSSSQQLLAHVQNFSTAIFITQTQIAGVSSAVAEYLAWLRQNSTLPKVPTDSLAVLETLETRVREVQEMAEEKHWVAWKQLVEQLHGIDGGSCSEALGEMEAVMRQRTAEAAQDFHDNYDVGKTVQEQMIRPQQEGVPRSRDR